MIRLGFDVTFDGREVSRDDDRKLSRYSTSAMSATILKVVLY